MIVKVFSGQETAKNVKQLLKQYRTLKRMKDPLVNEIEAAVSKLSQYEQTLIKQRYLSVEQFSVTKISINVYFRKTKVHEDLNNAMIQFAER